MPTNSNLQKIIKLTQTQYNTLSSGGSITYQGVTYTGLNDNYLYLIQDDTNYVVSVNNITPDANGNVNISIGTSYIDASSVTSQALLPNTYYDFGSRDSGSLSITLGTSIANILNEYMFEIVADENDFTLNTPSDIIWKDNAKVTNSSNALTLSGKNTYQFSIVNKKGIIADFANPTLATPTLTISGSTLSWGAITNAEKYQVTTDTTARSEQTTTSLNISSYYPTLGTLNAPLLSHSSTSVGTSTSNVTLSWAAVTNATGYKLTRSGASSATSTVSGTSTTVSSLTNGSTYNFVLTAQNNQTVSCKVTAKSKYYIDSTSSAVSYTYAKYNESNNSNTVSITIPYSITTGTVSGGTLTNTSSGIAPSGSTTVTISPNSGYTYPAQSAITVTNATISSYNASTGALTIANPTSNVKVSFTCPTA